MKKYNLGLKYELSMLKDFDSAYAYFERFLSKIDYFTFDKNRRVRGNWSKNQEYQKNLVEELKLVAEKISEFIDTLDRMAKVTDCMSNSDLSRKAFAMYYAVVADILAGEFIRKIEFFSLGDIGYFAARTDYERRYDLEYAATFFVKMPRAYGHWQDPKCCVHTYSKYCEVDVFRYSGRNTEILESMAVDYMKSAYTRSVFDAIDERTAPFGVMETYNDRFIHFDESLNLLRIVIDGLEPKVHNNYELIEFAIQETMLVCSCPEELEQLIAVIKTSRASNYTDGSIKMRVAMLERFHEWSSTNEKAVA